MLIYLPKIACLLSGKVELGTKTVWLRSLGSNPLHSPASTATIWKLKYQGVISNPVNYYVYYKLV
jgi:hypothetical protein